MKKRFFFIAIRVFLIIYGLVGIALYYFQDKLLFHPQSVAPDYKYQFKGNFSEQFIPVNSDFKIHLVKVIPQIPRKGLVIFFHGNMKNAEYYQKNIAPLISLGYEVWIPDYPKFGKSVGELSEENFNTLAIQTQRLAKSFISTDSIIVYGKSLGTGPAAYLAANSNNRMLILETPYSSIPSLFKRYAWMYPVARMAKFNFPVIDYLKDVKCPIVIFHGNDDEVIALKEAQKLKGDLKPGDRFITIDGGHHNDLRNTPVYTTTLKEVLK